MYIIGVSIGCSGNPHMCIGIKSKEEGGTRNEEGGKRAGFRPKEDVPSPSPPSHTDEQHHTTAQHSNTAAWLQQHAPRHTTGSRARASAQAQGPMPDPQAHRASTKGGAVVPLPVVSQTKHTDTQRPRRRATEKRDSTKTKRWVGKRE